MTREPWNKNKSVGQQIKEVRLKKGLSMYRLAKLAGLSRDYICRLESGKRNNPTIGTLNKIFEQLENYE